MISCYLTDIIKIISVKIDEWGNITEIESANIKARVEEMNKIVIGQDGKEVLASALIMIKSNNTITYGDKIKIVKKNGEYFIQPDKKFMVKSIYFANGFSAGYIEVYI